MGYVYNHAFKTGVVAGVLVFVIANIISYLVESQRYEEYLLEPIKFAPVKRLRWDFPFDGYYFGFIADEVLNMLAAIAFWSCIRFHLQIF
jgi:hypothetical protein